MPLQPPRRASAPVLRTKDVSIGISSRSSIQADQTRLIDALNDIARAARQLLSFGRIDARHQSMLRPS
jgi:hypothetical protein